MNIYALVAKEVKIIVSEMLGGISGMPMCILSAPYDMLSEQEKHQVKHQDKHQVELCDVQMAVLKVWASGDISRKVILAAIGLTGDSRSFKRHIEPLLSYGLVEMTVPDKPNSRLQKYKLTADGMEV